MKNINDLQIKSLDHVMEILKSVGRQDVFNRVLDASPRTDVLDNTYNEMGHVADKIMREEKAKVKKACDWLEVIITDLKKQ